MSRRKLLARALESALASQMLGCVPGAGNSASGAGLARIDGSTEDAVVLPEGYRHRIVLRWGDPLFAGEVSLDAQAVTAGQLMAIDAPQQQRRQFGYNCDGMAVFERADSSTVLCVNHEYPSPELMFPDWSAARAVGARGAFVRDNPQVADYMQASVGLTVVEVDRHDWGVRLDSPLNRRITASEPIALTGPGARHRLLRGEAAAEPTVLGTFGNCAAGKTPWGTYLSAEENVDDYFGNGGEAKFEGEAQRAHVRFGYRRRDSAFRWEYADPRFDMAANPNELLKFGWVVEVDPFDPDARPKKRTALGRFKHEGATCAVCDDGRVAVYMGDDQAFEYLYKFVTADRFDPANPRANADLLDHGTLYAAQFLEDGSGRWLPLVWNVNGALSPASGFASQADVVLRCREAADLLGATPLDRPEDVAVDSLTGRVYLSCTQNLDRGGDVQELAGRTVSAGTDAANPRVGNRYGHIVEVEEAQNDAGARTFIWDVFMLAGVPSRVSLLSDPASLRSGGLDGDATYFGGNVDLQQLSALANPDNMTCDRRGNLWVVTDGAQPLGSNNGCYICRTRGEFRGAVAQFMSGPVGAEISGCELTADERSLLLTIQHPGAGGSLAAPRSHWPDGQGAARPSLIVIEPIDPDARLGDA